MLTPENTYWTPARLKTPDRSSMMPQALSRHMRFRATGTFVPHALSRHRRFRGAGAFAAQALLRRSRFRAASAFAPQALSGENTFVFSKVLFENFRTFEKCESSESSPIELWSEN